MDARKLPKAELHLHIEGTLEPELMFELARRNKVALPYAGVAELRAAYAFKDLQSFLDVYYKGASVLKTDLDFFDLAWAYFTRAAAGGVRHAEIFFDPQTHTRRGVPYRAVLEGLTAAMAKARAELGVSSLLILCFLRHLDESDALGALEEALPFRDRIAGVGLDSSELGHPPAKFARVFARAKDAGLRLTAHAGEEGPPSYVREALDTLKVERIDHGVRSVEDPGLLRRLVAEEVPLTVCPLSNVKLRVFDRLEDHNLRALLDAGARVSLHSDDPAYFGGYADDAYRETRRALSLTDGELKTLARNSFLGSWLPDAEKARRVAEVDAA
ncbi:MAG: adenosine deaminase [Elusimicrobiota bacterium]|nr:adenosine deaminase [Elusimicrobiota bacterium]